MNKNSTIIILISTSAILCGQQGVANPPGEEPLSVPVPVPVRGTDVAYSSLWGFKEDKTSARKPEASPQNAVVEAEKLFALFQKIAMAAAERLERAQKNVSTLSALLQQDMNATGKRGFIPEDLLCAKRIAEVLRVDYENSRTFAEKAKKNIEDLRAQKAHYQRSVEEDTKHTEAKNNSRVTLNAGSSPPQKIASPISAFDPGPFLRGGVPTKTESAAVKALLDASKRLRNSSFGPSSDKELEMGN